MTGTVVWFDVQKGYGFIRSDQTSLEYFVHYSKILAEPGVFRVLGEGDLVSFEPINVDRKEGSKLQAQDVSVLENKGK